MEVLILDITLILNLVVKETKKILGDNLYSIILYGSYARGDYDDLSDIDIMILVSGNTANDKNISDKFIKLAAKILYDEGVILSFSIRDIDNFNQYSETLPYYRNILKEGIKIA